MNKIRLFFAVFLNLGGLAAILYEIVSGKVNLNGAGQGIGVISWGGIMWLLGLGMTASLLSHPYDNQWTVVNRILWKVGVLAFVFITCWLSIMPAKVPWAVFVSLVVYVMVISAKELYLLRRLGELKISSDTICIEQLWAKPLSLAATLSFITAVSFVFVRLSLVNGALFVSAIWGAAVLCVMIARKRAEKQSFFAKADLLLFMAIMLGGAALLALGFAALTDVGISRLSAGIVLVASGGLYYWLVPPTFYQEAHASIVHISQESV